MQEKAALVLLDVAGAMSLGGDADEIRLRALKVIAKALIEASSSGIANPDRIQSLHAPKTVSFMADLGGVLADHFERAADSDRQAPEADQPKQHRPKTRR